MGIQFGDKDVLLFHHVVEESGTLLPIGVEPNAHHAHVGCERLAPLNFPHISRKNGSK